MNEKKLNFLKENFGEFTPRYATIRSIKLYSENRDGKYYAVYISEDKNFKTIMLSLVTKDDKTVKDKIIASFPAYIKYNYIYLSDSELNDMPEYKLLKEFEEILVISPKILNLINKGYFSYFPKKCLIAGGEPSVSEESLMKSLGIESLDEDVFLDACIDLDYRSRFSIKNNHPYRPNNMKVYAVWNLCAYGTGMPNINVRHSVMRPFIFKEDDLGNKIVRGIYFTTETNRFFEVCENGLDVMIQYKDNVNTNDAVMITFNSYPNPDKVSPNIKVNYVVKPMDSYIQELNKCNEELVESCI